MSFPRKYIVYGFVIVSCIVGTIIGLAVTQLKAAPTFESTPTPTPYIGPPSLLTIPTLDINAAIEHVGLDQQKRMDVPQDVNNVAWYKLGPLPGQPGNAVLAGHLDSKTGPAV